MLRAGGLFRPAMRPVMSMRRPQLMSMTVTRDYTVPRDETTTRVLNVVKAFDKVNADAVVPTAHFTKDLGLDSLDIVELGLALEEEFAIVIPDQDAETLLSVPTAVDYLSTHPQSR